MTAINVASLAVLSSVGVNMLLDSMKEKKDAALREEIKDRLHDSLAENNKKIANLETSVQELVSWFSALSCLNSTLKFAIQKKLRKS